MKKLAEKKSKKAIKEPIDYYFGKPRLEMTGRECLVDGLDSVIEYSQTKIKLRLGSRFVTFFGDDLKINSFTREGAIVEGDIFSIDFSTE